MNNDYLVKEIIGQPIAFIDPNPEGSPLILLIHGLGADGSSWVYQLEVLSAAGMRPVAPDLPGFGKSPKPGGRWTIDKAADIMSEFLDSFGSQLAVVAGLSMGGAVAQQMALKFPASVNRLILLDTFANLIPKRKSETLYLVRRFITASFRGVAYQAEMVAQRLFPGQEQGELRAELRKRILEADPRVYRQAMIDLGLFNSLPQLKQLNIPVLVISAQNDTTVPMENQDDLARGIRGAKRVIIPNARHAVIIDQPELVNRAMIDFIKEI